MKRVSYGYTLQVDGNQVRVTRAEWTEDDAEKALAAAILERDVPKALPPASIIFGQASEGFLATNCA